MPLQFSSLGEYALRLRRSFQFRGNATLFLDENVVPVSLIEDLTQAPFRRGGRRWFGRVTGAAAALNNTTIVVANRSIVFDPKSGGWPIVLDWVFMEDEFNGFNWGVGADTLGPGVAPGGFTTESLGPDDTITGSTVLPVGRAGPEMFAFNSSAKAPALVFGRLPSYGQGFWSERFLHLGVEVPVGGELWFSGLNNNTALNLSFSGRVFDHVERRRSGGAGGVAG